jgi:hypothetical protein
MKLAFVSLSGSSIHECRLSGQCPRGRPRHSDETELSGIAVQIEDPQNTSLLGRLHNGHVLPHLYCRAPVITNELFWRYQKLDGSAPQNMRETRRELIMNGQKGVARPRSHATPLAFHIRRFSSIISSWQGGVACIERDGWLVGSASRIAPCLWGVKR